jgi:hypothetical protein
MKTIEKFILDEHDLKHLQEMDELTEKQKEDLKLLYMYNSTKHLERISKNVQFFFWIQAIAFVAFFIFISTAKN